MLGNVKIYFGKVVDVLDDEFMFRCRVKINGKTEQILDGDLPKYFPIYGVNYMPVVGSVVPVYIFDENIMHGFYGNIVGVSKDDFELQDADYENYLHIFKRTVGDNGVQLTYKESTGIEFVNGNGKIQIEIEKTTISAFENKILLTEKRTDIGTDGEATLLGDKTVKHLQNIIKHQNETIEKIYTLLTNLQSAASSSPYTAGLVGALVVHTSDKIQLKKQNIEVENETKTLQSKKVYIE